MVPARRAAGMGAVPLRTLVLDRSVGLDVGRRCAVGLCAVSLWSLGVRWRVVGLGARPGARRPVYAPALVAFVGGANFQIAFRSGPSGGGIGWFPLAPGEVYRPAYGASRDYVRNVNVSNTIVNTTVINNVYQNNVTQANYRNVQVANAVTAVPPAVFAQSQPVQRNAVAVSRDVAMRGQVTARRGGRTDSDGHHRRCGHHEQSTGAASAAAIGRRALGAARASGSGRAARGNAAA